MRAQGKHRGPVDRRHTRAQEVRAIEARAQRDPLWPNGDRPLCRNGDGRLVYMGGLCGECFTAEGQRMRAAELETLTVERLAEALHATMPDAHRKRECRDRHDLRAAQILDALRDRVAP